MTISARDARLLYQKSGNRCAFPECTNELTAAPSDKEGEVNLSEVAHIVSEKLDGPRGNDPLPLDKRDRYENLILLCGIHHHTIDTQVVTYPVLRLHQMKADHEELIRKATAKAVELRKTKTRTGLIRETLYSPMLPLEKIPECIYTFPVGSLEEKQIVELVTKPVDRKEMYPFIVREGKILCFQNLRYAGGPFNRIVKGKVGDVSQIPIKRWLHDPDKTNWFVTLLNRSLNKLTGRKGLNLDRDHNRYYFQAPQPGKELELTYRSLNKDVARKVVWQPITKKTQQPKNYWIHLAVAMKFLRVGENQWCLNLRPELHLTRDSQTPLPADEIGPKVTKKRSRNYNFDIFRELQFWRDFFADRSPRIILNFGKKQNVIISTRFLETSLEWPGFPEEFRREFKNVEYEENLFTYGDLLDAESLDSEDDNELEEWDLDE